MRKKKEIPISTFFKEEMKIKSKAIDLQNKGITVIDELSPFLSSEIEMLNLKNNKLTSLKGIEQLAFLRELDISFNKIASCRELQHIKRLPNLKKIYFGNNPFLSEPIDQDLLEVILQKETDLDILSFELIKELQNEEIKIIFLKNYLTKIKLHQELRANQFVEENNNKLKTQVLVDKIVPQFYSVIENQKLANSIKRQTLDLKKRSNETFEGALSASKSIKQKKIDQLIRNIVEILHQTNKFTGQRNFTLEVNLNNSTISFSPQKGKGFKNSMRIDSSDQFSPVKYIDFSKDDNTLQDIGLPNAKAYFSKGKQGILKVQKAAFEQRQIAQDNIETARKNKLQQFKLYGNRKIEEQFRGVHEKKLRIERLMQAEKQKQREKQMKDEKNKTSKVVNQPNKNTESYIKVVQSSSSYIGDAQNNQKNTNKVSYLGSPKHQTLKTPAYGQQSTVSWQNIIQSLDQLTPQNLQIIYYKNLIKIHPMFNLLHSPAQSLKDQEKNTIIEALKVSHKEYYIEWLKQKIINQSINRQLEQLKLFVDQKIEQTKLINKDTYKENVRLKQEFQWVDNRNKALQQDYTKLYAKFKEIQTSEKHKTIAMGAMQTSYKKIKETYLQKTQELRKKLSEDEKEDTIIQKRQSRLRKIYLSLISKKAELWKKVFAKAKKKQLAVDHQLIQWGLQSFKANFNLCKSIQQHKKIKKYLTQKYHFKNWLFCHFLQRKQKKVNQQRQSFLMREFVQLCKKNQAIMKLKKLKKIWAQRHYKQQKYKKSLELWTILRNKNRQNLRKAVNFCTLSHLNVYFNALKELKRLRKANIEELFQRHRDRRFEQQFKKMIYLMRKDVIVNSQKQSQVKLFYEKSCRIKNYNLFKKITKDLKKFKWKVYKAKIWRLRKSWKSLKKNFTFSLKSIGKLSNYCHYIYWKITKKAIKREKISLNYSASLLRNQKKIFVDFLRNNLKKEKSMRESWLKIVKQKQNKLNLLKLRFLKKLQIGRLYGRDLLKHRVIQQMGVQMSINDNQTFKIIKQEQSIIQKCEQQIMFLKKQIQMQSNRQLMLLTEKDELMLSVNESYEIIMQLRRQIQLLKEEHRIKDEQYKGIVRKYNQVVKAIQSYKRSASPLHFADKIDP